MRTNKNTNSQVHCPPKAIRMPWASLRLLKISDGHAFLNTSSTKRPFILSKSCHVEKGRGALMNLRSFLGWGDQIRLVDWWAGN